MTELQQRILSGGVLALLALGCIIAGGNFFFMLLAALCVGCLYEGYHLVRNWPGRVGLAVYILFAFSSAYVFRDNQGWIPFLLPCSTIMLTDIGAYFIGRRFGGPKLWWSVSPNKTWAGAIGGLVVSVLAIVILFWVVPVFQERMSFPSVVIMTVLTSVAAQAGDLFESWLKRKAGVKDSGNLIPGHGGIFDRLDSWIGAFFVNGLIYFLLLLLLKP